MCGINGVVAKDRLFVESALERAEGVQCHRGPDVQDRQQVSVGAWTVGLGHQRLSILDLSPAGTQPMSSGSGNSIIAYNGEVYNYCELEPALQLRPRKTSTDTEVVLEFLEQNGIEDSLNEFNGMWAFAWLDRSAQKLYLARDRVGIKPLYFAVKDGALFFASEVKGVLAAAGGKFTLNHNSVKKYISQALQDSTTETFFNEIESLPAGHFATVDLASPSLKVEMHEYWRVPDKVESVPTLKAAIEVSREIFRDAVRLRMRSDVPIGVTLSGGLDSSAIATVMRDFLVEGQELRILSAVSPGSAQDESEFIDIMGAELGQRVQKVELGWTADEAICLLRKVTWQNDSPLGSFSNVAHYLLMERASELGITVILSGQGADELLCGYKKYLGFYILESIRSYRWVRAFSVLLGFVLNRSIVNQFSFKEAKRYLPKFLLPDEVDILGSALKTSPSVHLGLKHGQTVAERQATDLTRYSVPFLTHYEDRMSMAWSREIRLPFLDYRLIEFFLTLPTSYKLRLGWTKYVFRKAMEPVLPKRITWRRDKQGFVCPQDEWLRSELKEEILEIFCVDALIFELGLIDRDALLSRYRTFCDQSKQGGKVWYREIFGPLALEIWLKEYQGYLQ